MEGMQSLKETPVKRSPKRPRSVINSSLEVSGQRDDSKDAKPNDLLPHILKKLKIENHTLKGMVDLQPQRRRNDHRLVVEKDPHLLLDKRGLTLIIPIKGESLHHLRGKEGLLPLPTLLVRVMNLWPP